MDWFLAATTLLVNANLGWSKGAWWAWVVHALNAALWIVYAVDIGQPGLVLLSVVTIAVDVVSARRRFSRSPSTAGAEGEQGLDPEGGVHE